MSVNHVPRNQYQHAYALANLAAILANSQEQIILILVCKKWVVPQLVLDNEEKNNVSIIKEEKKDWRQPIIDYLESRRLPDDLHKAEIRRCAPQFIYFRDALYQCCFDGILLRCSRAYIRFLEGILDGYIKDSKSRVMYAVKIENSNTF